MNTSKHTRKLASAASQNAGDVSLGKKINILEARNNLSRLVAAVAGGDEVVIANRGVPVARLVGVGAKAPEHTATQLAEWLVRNPVPAHANRTPEELDQQIAREREGWE